MEDHGPLWGWLPHPTIQRDLTHDELREVFDLSQLPVELAALRPFTKKIDGTMLYGVPLREMSKTSLMAAVVMLGEQYAKTLTMYPTTNPAG